jgi:hypothetical protein
LPCNDRETLFIALTVLQPQRSKGSGRKLTHNLSFFVEKAVNIRYGLKIAPDRVELKILINNKFNLIN